MQFVFPAGLVLLLIALRDEGRKVSAKGLRFQIKKLVAFSFEKVAVSVYYFLPYDEIEVQVHLIANFHQNQPTDNLPRPELVSLLHAQNLAQEFEEALQGHFGHFFSSLPPSNALVSLGLLIKRRPVLDSTQKELQEVSFIFFELLPLSHFDDEPSKSLLHHFYQQGLRLFKLELFLCGKRVRSLVLSATSRELVVCKTLGFGAIFLASSIGLSLYCLSTLLFQKKLFFF